MTESYRGCMTGRTLYVLPFCHAGKRHGQSVNAAVTNQNAEMPC